MEIHIGFLKDIPSFLEKWSSKVPILGNRIIGPFLDGNLNWLTDLRMLQDNPTPITIIVVAQNPREFRLDILINQDGVPHHPIILRGTMSILKFPKRFRIPFTICDNVPLTVMQEYADF